MPVLVVGRTRRDAIEVGTETEIAYYMYYVLQSLIT